MKLQWDKWLYGIGSAFIGGGAGAVTSGVSGALVAPAQFNLADWGGAKKLLLLMAINFLVNGALSMFFYLKQSPLAPPET